MEQGTRDIFEEDEIPKTNKLKYWFIILFHFLSFLWLLSIQIDTLRLGLDEGDGIFEVVFFSIILIIWMISIILFYLRKKSGWHSLFIINLLYGFLSGLVIYSHIKGSATFYYWTLGISNFIGTIIVYFFLSQKTMQHHFK